MVGLLIAYKIISKNSKKGRSSEEFFKNFGSRKHEMMINDHSESSCFAKFTFFTWKAFLLTVFVVVIMIGFFNIASSFEAFSVENGVGNAKITQQTPHGDEPDQYVKSPNSEMSRKAVSETEFKTYHFPMIQNQEFFLHNKNLNGHLKGSKNDGGLVGWRILLVICMLDFKNVDQVEQMLESSVDACAAGADMTVVLQTTEHADAFQFQFLRKRLRCSGSQGSLKLQIDVHPNKPLHELAAEHRQFMYNNLDSYDLFIYSEDDMDIRPSTVAAYISETKKIEAALPNMYKPHYSKERYIISFLRWERYWNNKTPPVTKGQAGKVEGQPTRFFWENKPEEYTVLQLDGLALDAKKEPYITTANPNSAMWMLTQTQMHWLRDLCQFDRADLAIFKELEVRPWVSSNQFAQCNVARVIPLHALEALAVHHLPDSIHHQRSEEIQHSKEALLSQELYELLRLKATKIGIFGE